MKFRPNLNFQKFWFFDRKPKIIQTNHPLDSLHIDFNYSTSQTSNNLWDSPGAPAGRCGCEGGGIRFQRIKKLKNSKCNSFNMSSNISTDADVLQADFHARWLQDHEYFALLSHSTAAREEAGVFCYSRHPDEIYSNPKSGLLYLIDNVQAACEFQRKVCKGSLCWKAVRTGSVKDKLGLEFELATALKRGRPIKKGVKTTYSMNIVKSSEHNAAICHLLIKTEASNDTPVVRKRQKVEEGIEWLLRAATELQQEPEVDYVRMFYSYSLDKFPRLVV